MPLRIDHSTRLSAIIDLDPRVVEYIVSLDPDNFNRLHNAHMRRLMASRIMLGRIAAMSNRPINDLLSDLAHIIGAEAALSEPGVVYPHSPASPPDWIVEVDVEKATIIDLLPFAHTLEGDVLPTVTRAVKQLPIGEALLIKHHWEPQPLYDIWDKMGGLDWYAEQLEASEWWVWIKRTAKSMQHS
jgi:Uncharacterized conserved protein (DUF2249)